jgi:hypothetical protein
MRRVIPILLAAALGLCSSLLVACGDRSRLIPASNADRLNSDLDAVSSAYGDGRCGHAFTAVLRAQRDTQSLPPEVDSALRARLTQGLDNLATVVRSCRQTKTTTTTSSSTTPTTTTTTSTPTTPTTTTTTTTSSSSAAPTSTQKTTPSPSGGSGLPGAAGNGAATK